MVATIPTFEAGGEDPADGWLCGMEPTSRSASVRRIDLASGLVAVAGLYQGAVPLVVRPLFGADQRFAPALWLPSPWWWIACIGIVVATLAVLVLLDDAKGRRRGPEDAASAPADTTPEDTIPAATTTATAAAGPDGDQDADGTGGYDTLSGLVFLVGIYNGLAPFVVRAFGGGRLLLSLPTRMSAPWWWITSAAVLVATVVALAWLDHAKRRHRDATDRSAP